MLGAWSSTHGPGWGTVYYAISAQDWEGGLSGERVVAQEVGGRTCHCCRHGYTWNLGVWVKSELADLTQGLEFPQNTHQKVSNGEAHHTAHAPQQMPRRGSLRDPLVRGPGLPW